MVGCLKMKDNHEYQYIITETGAPSSLDPLEADSTNNLPAARMLYLTPIEISPKDELVSSILSSFKYDPSSLKIFWEVRDDRFFENGNKITPDDVAFAVARMIYARDQFPVIRYIKGINEWKKQKAPLNSYPEGIKIKNQTVEIELSRRVEHPFFRFTLELFSIIPKSCVDLSTGRVVCDQIPASGYYRRINANNDGWKFELRDGYKEVYGNKLPSKIVFVYIDKKNIPQVINQGLDDYSVMATNQEVTNKENFSELNSKINIKYIKSHYNSLRCFRIENDEIFSHIK
jgi:hypothetical protein